MRPSKRDPNWRSKCYAQRQKSIAERIAEKAVRDPATGCLNWVGAADQEGYGVIRIDGKNVRLSRYILADRADRALTEDELACHSCDNPACIEPDHLWLGTGSDNQIDASLKGRHAHQRLTSTEVRLIRKIWAEGTSQAEICRMFCISDGYANSLVHRKKWHHLVESQEEAASYLEGCARDRPLNRGEAHGCAKLTEQSVKFIKQSNLPGVELARRFGVHPSSICDIRKGRRWKWVEA